jgi:dTDP-4-amino-4,6-dideoxygalactose transaminase
MYRGNEMMAAFAHSQLKRLPELTARAQANGARLAKALNDLPGVSAPMIPTNRTSAFHKYRVWVDPQAAGVDLAPSALRDATIKALRAEGCEVVMWQAEPLSKFPLFQELKGYGKGFPFRASDTDRLRANYTASYPNTVKLLDSSLVLFSQTCPLIAQTAETVDLYAEAFRKVWNERKHLAQVTR